MISNDSMRQGGRGWRVYAEGAALDRFRTVISSLGIDALLESEEGQRLGAVWEERLAGELPNYDMLYDRPQTTVEPSRYAWHPFHIEAALVERLKTFAKAKARRCMPSVWLRSKSCCTAIRIRKTRRLSLLCSVAAGPGSLRRSVTSSICWCCGSAFRRR